MTLEEKKIEIEEYYNLWIGNYNRKELTTNNVRIVAEALCKAVILSKKLELVGTQIILGKNAQIPKFRQSTSNRPLSFADLISVLKEQKFADKSIILLFDLIRDKTNPSSHSKNKISDITTPEDADLCNTAIKSIIKWFYTAILSQPLPPNLIQLIEKGRQIDILVSHPSEKWTEFEIATQNFDTRKFQYIFVSPENISDDNYTVEAFAKLPWRLVLDFDIQSDVKENGLLSNFNKLIGPGRKKIFTINDKIDFDSNFPHYWFLANGHSSMVSPKDYKSWRNTYKNFLSNKLYSEFVKGSRVKSRIVVLLDIEPKYAQDIIDEFNRNDEKNLHFLLCSETFTYDEIFDRTDNVELSRISATDIAIGIHNSISFSNDNNAENTILIPSLKEDNNTTTYVKISQDHYDYLYSLGIEVVYKGIENVTSTDETNTFFKGGTVTWRDLAEQKDLIRNSSELIQRRLDNLLAENKLTDIQLIHEAGAGGTTVSRRIAYNLSLKYPTVIIRKYLHRKTIDALRIIYDQYTKGRLPLLIVTESYEVRDGHLLYRDLAGAKKNAVNLIVHRGILSATKNKRFALKAQLEGSEINAFESSYKMLAPLQQTKIENITKDYKDNPKYISPVLYALTAFGKDYNGLENYVLKCLTGITLEQRKLTGFICLIYYYSQKSVPIELFSSLFKVDRSKCDLQDLFGKNNPIFDLLHQESDSNNEYYNYWRPRYALLGEEALQIILGGGKEYKKNWKNQLDSWLVELIRYVRDSSPYLDEDTAEIFNSLFIERSHLDDNGREKNFTKTFDDIANVSGGRSIFDALIEAYPDEAHYHGHYARYLYSDKIGIRDFDKAIFEAEASLAIYPDNSSLVHTLGMCYKEKAENLINSYENLGIPLDEAEQQIQILIEYACEKFDECIEIDRYNIYGYESQMRIILKALDFGFKIHPAENKESFITNTKNNWYAGQLDKVSSLLEESLYVLEQLKKVEITERIQKSEEYILDCESIFFRTLGRHLNAKTKFEELVKNTPKGYEYMRPHYRRMFVMCLLASKSINQKNFYQAWSKISDAELSQCVDYLDANIFEDPNNVQNIRLWFQAVRNLKVPPPLINTISRVSGWTQIVQQNQNSLLEGHYYLYVLNAIKAISEGNVFDPSSKQAVEDILVKMKPFVKNEKFCFEWFGRGKGLHQMVNHKMLGEYTSDFFEKNKEKLLEVTGRIKSIQSSQQGIITLDSGLEAFFVPNVHGFTERNINEKVKFFIGFRYDQIQAWSVLLLNTDRKAIIKTKDIEVESFIEVATDLNVVSEPEIKEQIVENVLPPKIAGPKAVGYLPIEEMLSLVKIRELPKEDIRYTGSIKSVTLDGGFIEVKGLDKDIAFRKLHIEGNGVQKLYTMKNVAVTVKFLNGAPVTDSSGRNYIAQTVYT